MRIRILVVSGLAFALAFFSGCATPVQQNTAVPFRLEDLKPYAAKGTAGIAGQAFLKTRGGDVKTAAGDEVKLIPATPYMKEVRRIRDSGAEPAGYSDEIISQIQPYLRTTIADAQGDFEFTGLPAGEYLIEAHIYWEVPGPYGMYKTGGLVSSYVTLTDGQTQKVILTR